jgi:hypothetical protein
MDKLKFWAGLVGAAVIAVLQVVGPDGPVGKILTVVAALATAVAVYRVPNQQQP